MLGSLKMYARYAAGLPRFLRRPITLEQARELVRRGLEQREERFLRLVERGVLPRPQSPYARLLRLARCEMGDVRTSVARHGLTKTLRTLREAGVYVSFEEFKGRQPVVRHGESFTVQSGDFQNPFLRMSYESTSGGSTGAGTRVGHDLDHLAFQAAHQLLMLEAQGTQNIPVGVWRGVLPDSSGLNNFLRCAHFGQPIVKWFVPKQAGETPPALRFQVGTYGTIVLSRLLGVPAPWPENVPVDEAITVARWMAETIRTRGACALNTTVSRALRVSVAAREAGLDLRGAVFQIAGEPPSPAKVAGIAACGARHYTNYGFTEGGRVALGCANPVSPNDLHVLRDAFEVFGYERQVPGCDVTVNALNITSLLPTSPQILLNAEMDDYGVVEDRDCGCGLGKLGYHQHVRDIHSFRKLTGEGVTLIGSDMVDVLERVLPARFGGDALDYQLAETEDANGFTRLLLRVSPRVRIENEQAVVETVLSALERTSIMAGRAQAIWRQAGSLQVRREEPVLTGRGKLMPLHLERSKSTGARA